MENTYLVNSADLTSVADAIRTKGETSGQLVFPSGFVEAVANIQAGSSMEQELTLQLYNSLQYSGLVHSGMSFSEMCEVLSEVYPALMIDFINTIVSDWGVATSVAQLTRPTVVINSSKIEFNVHKMNADFGYVDFISPTFVPHSSSKLIYTGKVTSENQTHYTGNVYLKVGGTYTELGVYGPHNTNFNNTVDLSSKAGMECNIVVRGYNGWKISNSDWLKMEFSKFEVSA